MSKELWTEKKIIKAVQDHHKEFLTTNQTSRKFNYTYLENKDSRLISAVQKRKISWVDLMGISGLDPSCHIAQINYGKTPKDRKKIFKYLVEQYVKEHGIENLNDRSMEGRKIDVPPKILKSKSSKICEI